MRISSDYIWVSPAARWGLIEEYTVGVCPQSRGRAPGGGGHARRSRVLREIFLPVHPGSSFIPWYGYGSSAGALAAGQCPEIRCGRAERPVEVYYSLEPGQSPLQVPLPAASSTHGMLSPWFKRKYPLKHLKKYRLNLNRMQSAADAKASCSPVGGAGACPAIVLALFRA